MDKNTILFIPHYINSLTYYDKLFDELTRNNIEVVYVFNRDTSMEQYCLRNKRNYEIVEFSMDRKLFALRESYLKFLFKKKVDKVIKKYTPKLIVQTNDMAFYNDIFVKLARKLGIISMGLQWAVTGPEKLYFRNRAQKRLKLTSDFPPWRLLISNFFLSLIKLVNFPFLFFLGVYSNHKFSIAQGNSDIFGVINNYTKNLLIKQGVNENKLIVTGSLHFDDALKTQKGMKKDFLQKKYGISELDKVVVYFSQPFYRKDITLLNFEDQFHYIEELKENLTQYYKEKGVSFRFFIKLHPVEKIANYISLNDETTSVLDKADNYELIELSNLCISQHSTVLQTVMVMRKPIISLNILNLEATEILSKSLGVKEVIRDWQEFRNVLNNMEISGYSYYDNIDYNNVKTDGKCYSRTIKLMTLLSDINKK